jgi:hypothetical protein
VHAPSEEKSDDSEDRYNVELELFNHFPKYYYYYLAYTLAFTITADQAVLYCNALNM